MYTIIYAIYRSTTLGLFGKDAREYEVAFTRILKEQSMHAYVDSAEYCRIPSPRSCTYTQAECLSGRDRRPPQPLHGRVRTRRVDAEVTLQLKPRYSLAVYQVQGQVVKCECV